MYRQEMAEKLRSLAASMNDVAKEMESCGMRRKRDHWTRHARELAGAAMICYEWAQEIEKEST